jgi:hypothetical protein
MSLIERAEVTAEIYKLMVKAFKAGAATLAARDFAFDQMMVAAQALLAERPE